jgi:hypothetical protein
MHFLLFFLFLTPLFNLHYNVSLNILFLFFLIIVLSFVALVLTWDGG